LKKILSEQVKQPEQKEEVKHQEVKEPEKKKELGGWFDWLFSW